LYRLHPRIAIELPGGRRGFGPSRSINAKQHGEPSGEIA
jgi:hypothetical protein